MAKNGIHNLTLSIMEMIQSSYLLPVLSGSGSLELITCVLINYMVLFLLILVLSFTYAGLYRHFQNLC